VLQVSRLRVDELGESQICGGGVEGVLKPAGKASWDVREASGRVR
jgi:hypothetical protein